MNCSFNIRYKPKTTRGYTKSDLTVYDSAGNTALNALTVYGKSEVVNDTITSAGEGGNIKVRTESKNSLNITATTQTINGVTFTVNPDNTITVNGTATATARLNIAQYTLMGRTVRYLSGTPVVGRENTIRLGYQGYSHVYYPDTPLVADRLSAETDWTNNVYIEVAEGYTANNLLFKPMMSYSSDITYEPYIGDKMAVFTTGTPLRGITGGTRDVMMWNGSAGAVTKNCGEVDLGSLTWSYNSQVNSFISSISNGKCQNNALGVCAKYESVAITHPSELQNKQLSVGLQYTGQGTCNVLVKDTDYTDATTFKTAMSGVKLVYELKTPTTEQLTTAENASIAGLRTFTPQTHAQNNAQTEMTVDYTIRVPAI